VKYLCEEVSCIVVERSLLLCLYLGDALNEVLMSELCGTSSEADHASFNTNGLKLGSIELLSAPCKFLEVDIILIYVHLS